MPSLPLWLATAGCPSATVTAALSSGSPQLIGFMEFGALSNPPVLYRTVATAGGWTWSRTLSGDPTWTEASAAVGATNFGFAADGSALSYTADCVRTDTNIFNVASSPTTTNLNILGATHILSDDGVTPSGGGLGGTTITDPVANPGGSGVAVALVSKTVLTLTQPGWSSDTDAVTSGVFTFTLTDPDSETDALTRFLAGAGASSITAGPVIADIFAAGIFSLHESRIAGATAFGYCGGNYQLNISNLATGVNYHYVVVWEGRTAAGDGSGDESVYGSTWTNTDSQSGDFTATGITQVISSLSIPIAAGYQKRIKSISVTPV